MSISALKLKELGLKIAELQNQNKGFELSVNKLNKESKASDSLNQSTKSYKNQNNLESNNSNFSEKTFTIGSKVSKQECLEGPHEILCQVSSTTLKNSFFEAKDPLLLPEDFGQLIHDLDSRNNNDFCLKKIPYQDCHSKRCLNSNSIVWLYQSQPV